MNTPESSPNDVLSLLREQFESDHARAVQNTHEAAVIAGSFAVAATGVGLGAYWLHTLEAGTVLSKVYETGAVAFGGSAVVYAVCGLAATYGSIHSRRTTKRAEDILKSIST